MLIGITVTVTLKGQRAGRTGARADAIHWLEAQAADPGIEPLEPEEVINPDASVPRYVARLDRGQ